MPVGNADNTVIINNGETEADIHARVDFELALQRLAGNHAHFTELNFKGCELTRKPDWMKKLCEALATNDTVHVLDLSRSALDDAAVQQLVLLLCTATRCAKLRKLDLSGNPDVSVAGETMAQGLCKMRKGFEVVIGPGFDCTADTFGCDKKLVETLTAWNAQDLLVPNGGNQDYYCPTEITGDGPRMELERGVQGTNGIKYRCELADFELFHSTGNMVLQKLKGAAKKDDPGVVV